MQKINPQLFEKIERLANTVKQEFKQKGLAIPHKNRDGSVQMGDFIITKHDSSFWIRHVLGYDVAGPINLAQTAAVIANDLALGRAVDLKLLTSDKWYGYKAFDVQACQIHVASALKKKDYDKADYNISRIDLAQEQMLYYKRPIDSRFAKLRSLT
jgi:hypothetical protein